MAIFGGRPKGFDTQALQNILNQGAAKQTSLVEQAFSQTPQLTQQFTAGQQQAGDRFASARRAAAQAFGQQLQGIESPDFVRAQQAKARELAFRDLPAAQQAVRENLAATGGLNRGAAITALQQPVLQAQRAASDAGFRIQQEARARDIGRQREAINQIFNTEQGIALERLGIDRNVANVLLETGRSDILDRAMRLAEIEAGRTQGLLDIEQLRQSQEIARDQAKQAQRGALIGSLGSLAGTGIGALTGNPFGAAIGSSIGGQLGGIAGGGSQPLDLTGILSLLALQRQGRGSGIRPIEQPIAPPPVIG